MGRREQAQQSRAALVDAARSCFTESGYEGTTVAAILDRAGMARGALYHYFPDGKREIFTAVFEQADDAFHERRDALLEIASPLARIRNGMRVFLELCTRDDFARIVLIDAPKIVPGQGDLGSTYELLREQLAMAIAAGEIEPCDPEVTAIALHGAARRAGEYVVASKQRRRASARAIRSMELMIDGLAAVETRARTPRRSGRVAVRPARRVD
ncbi:MAG TPA: TetR/AcrR family transcriptional regulator [Acidimicrobiia bacterium]|nr:TetR/AcrR family transcriptional regulator [Acidimicrobiia bacterium]